MRSFAQRVDLTEGTEDGEVAFMLLHAKESARSVIFIGSVVSSQMMGAQVLRKIAPVRRVKIKLLRSL